MASSESELIELPNGDIRMFYRNFTGHICYADAVRDENGDYTFGKGQAMESVSVESTCNLTAINYSKKIDGRWWFIDPLGYPCIVRTISGPTINYLGSPNQKKAALDKYGTSEKWTIATIRWLKTEVGFNAARNVSSVEEPCILEKATGGFAAGYGSKLGTNKGGGGSTKIGRAHV